MSEIEALKTRLLPGGDLNEACVALEELTDSNPKNPANAFYALVMNFITMNADGLSGTQSRLESQAARFPEQAVTGFKATYGEDARFEKLIEAVEGALSKDKPRNTPPHSGGAIGR